jgi:CheY-like chemotaxis protein
LAHYPQLSGIGGVERLGIVHRLDKDTSGAIVVAKDDITHRGLACQFADRQVKKRYLAVVSGDIRQTTGVVDAAIGRHPVSRQRMSTHTRGGREAVTEFHVLERFEHHTLVELRPRTGRTHQIRVHMAALGHPLLGDPTYGHPRKALTRPSLARQLSWFRRQALHAWVLGFTHPVTGEPLECRAPLPDDLERLLAILRQTPGRAEEKVPAHESTGAVKRAWMLKGDRGMTEPNAGQQRPVFALVDDLFFTLKISDTAKHLGLPIQFAASAPEFLGRLGGTRPALVIVDLTLSGVDMAALFTRLTSDPPQAAVPILGYTTHADWKHTSPLHDKCTKVVTKDTLSRNLAALMQQLMQPT